MPVLLSTPSVDRPISAGDAEDKILDEMLGTGVIEPANSSWASPVYRVKKDGTYHFCMDYRRVNAVSNIKDALNILSGSRYFATFDLLSGHWQLGMTDHAQERSAFCTRRGLFQFTRIPLGLSVATGSFCRLTSISYCGTSCGPLAFVTWMTSSSMPAPLMSS